MSTSPQSVLIEVVGVLEEIEELFAPVLSFLLQALKDMLSLDALIETLLFLQTNNACEANAVILAAELLMAASPEAMHSALKSSVSLPGLIHYSFCQV